MKIYIAGKITGEKHAKEKFEDAERLIKLFDHIVLNPMKNIGFGYKEYIDMGLYELSKCDAIYMLKDWCESDGARLEHEYAKTVGMKIIYAGKGGEELCL